MIDWPTLAGSRTFHRRRLSRLRAARCPTPGPAPRDDLVVLLAALWRSYGDRLWTVADLRAWDLIEAETARPLGRALAKAIRAGGHVGGLRLIRDGIEREGAVYRLAEVVKSR